MPVLVKISNFFTFMDIFPGIKINPTRRSNKYGFKI